MSNGIADLLGDATSPDPEEEKRRRLFRLMAEARAERRAPWRPDYTAELPFSRPDTLMGDERGDMMRFLDRYGADTTQVSQGGIQDFFQGDEYGDILGLIAQMRENAPAQERLSEQRMPSVGTYSSPTSVGGTYYEGGGEPINLSAEEIANLTPEERSMFERPDDSIRLNILNAMLGQHGRRTNVLMGKEGWEQEPEEDLRGTLAHELGHSLGAGEQGSDDFAAVVQAVRSASPDASFEDVLDAAQRIYWSDSNAYKHRRAGDRQTGRGSYEDPFVYDPQYIQDIKEQQNIEMRPWLEKVLATPAYADHPIHALEAERIELERLNNRGFLEKFSDKVRQGIGSLWQ